MNWERIDENTWRNGPHLIKRVFEDGATLFHVMREGRVVATGYDLEDAMGKAKLPLDARVRPLGDK